MPHTSAQAVIFDLDGTLANSEVAHERALRAAAEHHGMTFTPEWFRTHCVGLGERACFSMLAEVHGLEMTESLLRDLVARKLERFEAAVRQGEAPPFPGAVELVRAAAARGPVAVCSGSSRGSVGPMLETMALGEVLAAVVTSGDISRPKPDPEAYLLAAERLGVRPGRCVAVEDSPTGIASARAAGVRVVAVEHSFGRDHLGGADAVVRTIGDLSLEALLGGA